MEHCFWTHQPPAKGNEKKLDQYYKTSCGDKIVFTYGTVADHKYLYCPFCGLKIEIAKGEGLK